MGKLAVYAYPNEEFKILTNAIETHKDELGEKYESLHDLAVSLNEQGTSREAAVSAPARDRLCDAARDADLPLTRGEVLEGMSEKGQLREYLLSRIDILSDVGVKMPKEDYNKFKDVMVAMSDKKMTKDDYDRMRDVISPMVEKYDVSEETKSKYDLDSRVEISVDDKVKTDRAARIIEEAVEKSAEKRDLNAEIDRLEDEYNAARNRYGANSQGALVKKIKLDYLRAKTGEKVYWVDVVFDIFSFTQANIFEYALKMLVYSLFDAITKERDQVEKNENEPDHVTKPEAESNDKTDRPMFQEKLRDVDMSIFERKSYQDVEDSIDSLKTRIEGLQSVLSYAGDTVSADDRKMYEEAIQEAKEGIKDMEAAADKAKGLEGFDREVVMIDSERRMFRLDCAVESVKNTDAFKASLKVVESRIEAYNEGLPDVEKLSFDNISGKVENADKTSTLDYVDKAEGMTEKGFAKYEEMNGVSIREPKFVAREEYEPRDRVDVDKALDKVKSKMDAVAKSDRLPDTVAKRDDKGEKTEDVEKRVQKVTVPDEKADKKDIEAYDKEVRDVEKSVDAKYKDAVEKMQAAVKKYNDVVGGDESKHLRLDGDRIVDAKGDEVDYEKFGAEVKDYIDRENRIDAGKNDVEAKSKADNLEAAVERYNASVEKDEYKVEITEKGLAIGGKEVSAEEFAEKYHEKFDGVDRIEALKDDVSRIEERIESVDLGEHEQYAIENGDVTADQREEYEQIKDRITEIKNDVDKLEPNDIEKIEKIENEIKDIEKELTEADKAEGRVEVDKEDAEKSGVDNEAGQQQDVDNKEPGDVDSGTEKDVEKPESDAAAVNDDEQVAVETEIPEADAVEADKEGNDVAGDENAKTADVEATENENEGIKDEYTGEDAQMVENDEEYDEDPVDYEDVARSRGGSGAGDDDVGPDVDDIAAGVKITGKEDAADDFDISDVLKDLDGLFDEDIMSRDFVADVNGVTLENYMLEYPEGSVEHFLENFAEKLLSPFDDSVELSSKDLLVDAASVIYEEKADDVAKFLYEDMKDADEGLMKAFDALNGSLFNPDQMEGLAERFADFVSNDLFGEGAGVRDVVAIINEDGEAMFREDSDKLMREIFGDEFTDALLDFIANDDLSGDVISQDYIMAGTNGDITIDINPDNVNDIIRGLLDTGIERVENDIFAEDNELMQPVANDGINDVDMPTGLEDDVDIDASDVARLEEINRADFAEDVVSSEIDPVDITDLLI